MKIKIETEVDACDICGKKLDNGEQITTVFGVPGIECWVFHKKCADDVLRDYVKLKKYE